MGRKRTTLIVCILYFSVVAGTPARAEDKRIKAGQVVSVGGKVLVRAEVGGPTALGHALKAGDFLFQGDVINTASNGTAKLLLLDKSIIDVGSSALFEMKKFQANNGNDRVVDVAMPYGTIRAAINHKIEGAGSFKIRTRTATMGVRGTEFVVKASLDAPAQSQASTAAGSNTAGGPDSRPGTASAPSAAKTEITVIQGQVDVLQTPEKPSASSKLAAGKDAQSRKPAAAPVMVSLTAGQQITATNVQSETPIKPVMLSQDELKQTVAVAKVEDNTFKTAITLDATGSSGDKNGGKSETSSVTNTTQAVIAAAVTSSSSGPSAAPSAGNSGFIGTFGNGTALTPPPVVIPVGGFRQVRVVIKR